MKKGLFTILIGWLIISCGDGNVKVNVDPAIQKAEDIAKIDQYLADKGYKKREIDTTVSGVRYVIIEEGTGEMIDESDFVTFDYTGMLLNDTIFDTTIKEVGDSIRAHFLEDSVGLADKSIHELFLLSFTEDRNYNPVKITYSGSGWTLQAQFIPGFTSGLTASFRQMRAGGKALIVIPSGSAYGTTGSGVLIGPNTPLAFELYPVEVTKQ